MSSAAEDLRKYQAILRKLEQRARDEAEVTRALTPGVDPRELIVDPITGKVFKVVGGTQVYEVNDLAGKADVLPTVDPGKMGPGFSRTEIMSFDPHLVYEPIWVDPMYAQEEFMGIGQNQFDVEVWALYQGGWGIPARQVFGIPYKDLQDRLRLAVGNDPKEAMDQFKALIIAGKAYQSTRGTYDLITRAGFDSGKLISTERVAL